MTIDKATLDTIGFIMTVGGIVLSIVALVLSILFYAWADRQAKESATSLVELRAASDGLAQLVKTLREESFTLLKSAYTDMGEIAKFGVRRDSSDHVVLTPPEYKPPRIIRTRKSTSAPEPDPAKTSKERNEVVPLMDADDLQRITLTLGSHMMKRRGTSFASALQQAQKLIDEVMDEHPDGAVVTTEEFAEALKPYGFDLAEVAYTLAVMTATGPLERDEK